MAAPDTSGRRGAVLVSVTEKPGGYAESLLKLLEGTWKESQLPDFFELPTKPVHIDLWNRCLESCEDYFGLDSREYRLLKLGIVVHHGKMPGLMARLLVQVIEAGIVHLVIATSTLTEGVNLPFDTILIPRLDRYSGDVSSQEFANLVGRAGRPGRGVEGRGLVVLYDDPKAPRSLTRKVGETSYRYERIVAELRENAASIPSNASSPLAELLLLVRDCWVELDPNGTEDDFMRWLEVTAVPDSFPNDKDKPALMALDELDGVLLPTVVEAETSGNYINTEQALIGYWQRSYAYVASSRREQLQQAFTKRGCALRDGFIEDRSERNRIYRTGLTPKNARLLLKGYGHLRTILEEGRDFATRSPLKRFQFVEAVIQGLSDIPTFQPRPTKLGNDWSAVLQWWLAPALAREVPKPAKIAVWQEYASSNFSYRAAWGVGSVLALIADEEHGGELRETSWEEWERIDLPWSAMWLKELMVWGTLEPVAAYLLSKGHASTRKAAETHALRYYSSHSSLTAGDSNGLLHPSRIKEWTEANFREAGNDERRFLPTFPVVLSRDFSKQQQRRWRVVPHVDGNAISWFDPSGIPDGQERAARI